jgi:Xaa-Pro aminopeptidase
MSILLRESAGSDSSHELATVTDPRYLEIDQKHLLLAEYLESNGYAAIVLQNPWNFAWFTAGGNNTRDDARQVCGTLFITPDARVVLTSNVDSPWLFETQIRQLGFQLKERPWQEHAEKLVEDLCRGRKVVSDTGVAGTKNVADIVTDLRLTLSLREQLVARSLGTDLTAVVERSAAKSKAGQSELDIAGSLIHRLIRKNITPVSVQVTADLRRQQHPYGHSGDQTVQNVCSIAVVGRREGLCVGVERTVVFGAPSPEFLQAYQAAALVQATGIAFSKPDWELEELWTRIRRIYEKFGFRDEWRRCEQAEVIAHQPREMRLVPHSPFRLAPGLALHWHPLVRGVGLGDTILVTSGAPQILTRSADWPEIRIEVKGEEIRRPGWVQL